MISVSSLYSELWDQNPETEVKVIVADTITVGMSELVSMSTESITFSSGTTDYIGLCKSTKLNISMKAPAVAFPSAAKLEPFYRLVVGDQVSEWVPQGTYYIDTRSVEVDEYHDVEVLTLEAYDSMIKANYAMFTNDGDQGNWPMTDIAVVTEIATRLGLLGIDPRTVSLMNKAYEIQYPGYGDGGFLIKEVLGYIGTMYVGNWVITPDNYLRLVTLYDPIEHNHLLINENGYVITFGGTAIIV